MFSFIFKRVSLLSENVTFFLGGGGGALLSGLFLTASENLRYFGGWGLSIFFIFYGSGVVTFEVFGSL